MIKIILLGYMGSGKTAVAQLLSKKLQIPTLDLDEIIEAKAKLSIPAIFKEKGEIYFRKLEHLSFRETLNLPGDLVLSLGGGTPCYADNHELLNAGGAVSVYLKASVPTLLKRLEVSGGRPLLEGMDIHEKQEFIAKHLFDRSYYYNQAKYKIAVDGKSPDAIATEIISLLA